MEKTLATFFNCSFHPFYAILWDMIGKHKQIIRLSLSAEAFDKARTAALARGISIEALFLGYVDKDYSLNGPTMEAHLDAKNEARYS